MSIAGAVFKAAGRVARNPSQSARSMFQGAAKGAGGTMNLAFTGLGVYTAHAAYSDRYGSGAAVGIGLGEAALFTALPMVPGLLAAGAIYGIPALKEYGQDQYKRNRRLNMGRPMHDPFGTMATMRQRSASTLQRGRAVLGSEARLWHR